MFIFEHHNDYAPKSSATSPPILIKSSKPPPPMEFNPTLRPILSIPRIIFPIIFPPLNLLDDVPSTA